MCVKQLWRALKRSGVLIFSLYGALHAQVHQFSPDKTLEDFSKKVSWQQNTLKIDLQLHKIEQQPVAQEVKKNWPTPLAAQSFSHIQMKGVQISTRPKQAQLPYFSFIVEGDIEQMKFYQTIHDESFLKGIRPLPAPVMPCRCAKDEVQWSFKTSEYFNNARPLVEWEALGDFRGQQIVRVTIKPMQVDRDGLRVVHDLSLEIEGAQRIFQWQDVWEKTQQRSLLIVAPEKLLKGLTGFISQKRVQGFSVHQLKYQNESAAQLTQKIAAIQKNTALDYAIIVGSEDTVPTHYVRTSADWNTPSDRPYFSFGGPRDRVPDVVYARIVADNPSELEGQLKKFQEYENRLYSDRRGLKTSMVVASDEGFNPTDFEYAQQMLIPLQEGLGWTPSYLFQGQSNASAQNIIKRLNQGVEWFDYIGHGEGDRWPSVTGLPLTTEHFKNLKSQVVKPIVIDVACQNGRLSRDNRIGVELMNLKQGRAPAGAVAYLGGSVDISWHPPAAMAVHISELRGARMFESLGELIFGAQMRLLETFDDIVAASENIDWYHLQGDPTMLLQD